jgi:uncharacterized membrane protein
MYIKTYIACIFLLILCDAPYLYLCGDLYSKATLAISGKPYTKRYYSAVIVYLALSLGIVFLVLPRMRTAQSNNVSLQNRFHDAILYGGIFGLASYATFDFTMHFMFEKWDLSVSIMDSIWGSILCSIVAFILSFI